MTSGTAPVDNLEVKRIEALERLVSSLRHDLRGLVTPAALIADRLRQSGDPDVQRSAERITGVVERVIVTLNATYELVPARSFNHPTASGYPQG